MGQPRKWMEEQQTNQRQKNNKITVFHDITSQNVSSGLISFTLVMTGPALIILQAAAAGHFTSQQTISWIFSVYVFGGLFGVLMPLAFKIPVTGAHSISGVAFLATVTAHFTYPQLIGGYLMSGLLMFLIGVSGVFTKIMRWVPKEVISAMLAGLVTNYVVQIVSDIKVLPWVGGAALISFLISTRFAKRIPAIMVAVVVAFITLFITQDLAMTSQRLAFSLPTLNKPEFSWLGMVTLALPLAMLILSNDVATGIGALESEGYHPPIRKIVSWSGIFSMIAGIFGGQSANIAGMMSAICSNREAGVKQKRYVASLVSGILTILFGFFSWKIVPFIQSLPHSFVTLLAGFSLIGVLLSSLQMGFSNQKFRFSALFAFLIALSQVSFFHISAPVWGLVVGAVIAKTIEK